MIDKNPFADSWGTYAWAVGLAMLGGLVKYLNKTDRFKPWTFVRDLVTAGFCGLLTYWMCEWMNIQGPLSAVLIAASGLMGTRLLKEIENLYRIRMGLEPKSPLSDLMDKEASSDIEAKGKSEGKGTMGKADSSGD